MLLEDQGRLQLLARDLDHCCEPQLQVQAVTQAAAAAAGRWIVGGVVGAGRRYDPAWAGEVVLRNDLALVEVEGVLRSCLAWGVEEEETTEAGSKSMEQAEVPEVEEQDGRCLCLVEAVEELEWKVVGSAVVRDEVGVEEMEHLEV